MESTDDFVDSAPKRLASASASRARQRQGVTDSASGLGSLARSSSEVGAELAAGAGGGRGCGWHRCARRLALVDLVPLTCDRCVGGSCKCRPQHLLSVDRERTCLRRCGGGAAVASSAGDMDAQQRACRDSGLLELLQGEGEESEWMRCYSRRPSLAACCPAPSSRRWCCDSRRARTGALGQLKGAMRRLDDGHPGAGHLDHAAHDHCWAR